MVSYNTGSGDLLHKYSVAGYSRGSEFPMIMDDFSIFWYAGGAIAYAILCLWIMLDE